jgi:hypothetical protein
MQLKSHNYLLAKDDVGKAKPTTRKLPTNDHAYGKVDTKDPEGVSQGNTRQQSREAGRNTCTRSHSHLIPISRKSTHPRSRKDSLMLRPRESSKRNTI